MKGVVGPALFLTNSWFWCIGGFFPVLLWMDFGDAAFPAFAIFNILGAAAFGFVWSDARRRAFLARSDEASRVFSLVVIGFHVFFVLWISVLLGAVWPACIWLAATLLFRIAGDGGAIGGGGLFLTTLALFAAGLMLAGDVGPSPVDVAPFLHQIAPLALGFLLAPAFDRTFHRSFAATDRPRAVFALAFCGFFAVLLAAMYFATPVLAGAVHTSGDAGLIIVAIMLQAGFTTAAHLREVEETTAPCRSRALTLAGAAALVGIGLSGAALLSAEQVFAGGALLYRSLVFVIGGVFPTLLLFRGVNRWSLAALGFISPCYTLGFLIGGAWAPFLSVALAGLALIYAAYRMNGAAGARSLGALR